MTTFEARHASLAGKYVPVAQYIHTGDFVEYVRADVPCVYRRIDEFLTLALDLHTRTPIGFRLKGFQNFFLKHLKPRYRLLDRDFVALVSVIEIAAATAGEHVFSQEEAKSAYSDAYRMAFNDQVELRDMPIAA